MTQTIDFFLVCVVLCVGVIGVPSGRPIVAHVDEVRAAVVKSPGYAHTADVTDTWREQTPRNLRLDVRIA